MIKVSIIQKQHREVEQFRLLAFSRDSEKALMILLSSEGKKFPKLLKY